MATRLVTIGTFPTPVEADLVRAVLDEAEAIAAQTDPGDAQAWRAWRAAVFGIFLLPPVVTFYSLWILLGLTVDGTALSASGRRKFWASLLVDILVLAAVAILGRLLVSSLFR